MVVWKIKKLIIYMFILCGVIIIRNKK